MPASHGVFILCLLIAAAAALAAAAGLFWPAAGEPFDFRTLRGQVVEVCGRGLYRYDTTFTAAGFRGQDAATLAIGVPLLVLLAALYRRGSLRAALLLTGILAYFLYVYASMALNAAFNQLFLLYVFVFSASLFGLVLAARSVDSKTLSAQSLRGLPRKGPAALMLAGGAITLAVWLGPLVEAMLRGRPPALLGSYATMVTDALDLGVITPATFVCGLLILRRDPLGYRLLFPLLGIIVMLLPVIAMGTVFQHSAGVRFSAGEIVGPISGFALLGLLSVWAGAAVLRRLPGGGSA